MSIGLYFLQFLATLFVGVNYENMEVLAYSMLPISIVVLVGILVGIHANSFGQIHLNSLITVLPLAAMAMIPMSISYLFPFIYIAQAIFTLEGFLFSWLVILGLYIMLLVDVSRL